jgi:hypothetical protein
MKHAVILFALATACGPKTHGPSGPTETKLDDTWQPLSFGSYLAPKELGSTTDVVFHFHAAKAAESEYRSANLHAVIVSFQLTGIGTTPYWQAMDDPDRFEKMKAEVMRSLGQRAGHDVAIGRIAVVAWSAGYASVQRIILQQRHYDEIDALILLDALHTGYLPNKKVANLQTLAPFVRFAKDAAAGKKLFVFTHSSIVPEGYASTREVGDALAEELGAKWTTEPRPGPPGAFRSADNGDAHIRGWDGMTAKDHVIHDHFIDEVITTWLAPRWAR